MLEVLEVGFGEELLARSSSPILPRLSTNRYELLREQIHRIAVGINQDQQDHV